MVSPDKEVLCEIKGYKTAVKTSAVMQVNVQNLDVNLKAIIDANKYGDFGKLLRVTSYCLRFLHNLKCKHHKRELLTGLITSQEISDAECQWLREVQTNVLKEKGDKYLKQISKELGLFYDKRGILRCRGRLSNSTLPYSAKYPALLLKDHKFAELFVKECHL